jgi:cystathionine beta-lyase/cystathionine gamma-synthase
MNYKYKLRENDDEGKSSRLTVDHDVTVTTPDIKKAMDAIGNINNYGIYKSNMRKEQVIEDHYGPTTPSTKNYIQSTFKAIQEKYKNEDKDDSLIKAEFVETISKKNKNIKNLEIKYDTLKSNNGNFYPKTSKDEMDKYSAQYISKPKLINPEVKGDKIIFPKDKNPSIETTKKIIKTVMDTAKVDFKFEGDKPVKKVTKEAKEKELRLLIREEIKNILK